MKRTLFLGLLLLSGCSPTQTTHSASSQATIVPTPQGQSAFHPQSNASAKNDLPPKIGTSNGACPIGATAVCKDGSFTDSNNRKIACNQRGGIRKWCQ